MRKQFIVGSLITVAVFAGLSWQWHQALWCFVIVGPLVFIGWRDLLQTRQAIRRNFPILGNFRYLFEAIRPEINQYFVESNTDGVPFNRDLRSLVYQRSKKEPDTVPF